VEEAGIRTILAQPTIAVRIETQTDELSAVFARELPNVACRMEEVKALMIGPPFGRYHAFGPERVDVEIGAPVASVPAGLRPIADLSPGEIGASVVPGGEVASTTHVGPFDGLAATYAALAAWIVDEGRVAGDGPWEVYLTDPELVPDPAEWLTEVVWPLAPGDGS
jgi:hypothetical protein